MRAARFDLDYTRPTSPPLRATARASGRPPDRRGDRHLRGAHAARRVVSADRVGCTNSILLQISTSGVATELMHPTPAGAGRLLDDSQTAAQVPVGGERRHVGDDRRAERPTGRKSCGTERHTAEREQRSGKTADDHGSRITPRGFRYHSASWATLRGRRPQTGPPTPSHPSGSLVLSAGVEPGVVVILLRPNYKRGCCFAYGLSKRFGRSCGSIPPFRVFTACDAARAGDLTVRS
jgi:hypothetical protein